MKYLKIFFPL